MGLFHRHSLREHHKALDPSGRYAESRRVTLLGAVKNGLLSIAKIIFGIIGHSHALFADGIHSLSDLLIDALVLVASRFGSRAADAEHPYGHARIETAATFLLAFILSLAAIGIIIDAGKEVLGIRTAMRPDLYVVYIVLFSILLNEILYRYTRRVGERIKSTLLVSNAWHHRSDAASSLVVLVGVLGAWLGYKQLDAAAAIIVGVMIIKMAWQFGWSSIRELVDTGLDAAMLEKITSIIIAVPGVCALHQLRSRSLGGKVFVDVHILVDPLISVSEGHFIGQEVHYHLTQNFPDVIDVTVHVDPEDDEVYRPSRDLPPRHEIINLLKERWHGLVADSFVENVVLHYLAGKLRIEVCLPLDKTDEQLAEKLQKTVSDIKYLTEVKVYFF